MSIYLIFEYLHATLGSTTDLDLKQNEEKMRQPWNQDQLTETSFQQLEEANDCVEHGNSPFANYQILPAAHVIMN